ncbi:hypothetical protein [Xylanibacter muris]|uniref:Uncharacterized protein n=1 Tax=Xylanibacter muris TaxID=2736290 RepID=A0ABX2AM07_9BACT|nr:hypothetical protein [Xylanibacter muris]NPD91287.1 hypothetical protein [Xylanibacter muris]
MEGGATVTWQKPDFICVIDYYSTIDVKFVTEMKLNYYGLSPKSQLFMILEHENMTDDKLMKIFGIGSSSVRSMRSRIKSKKKD